MGKTVEHSLIVDSVFALVLLDDLDTRIHLIEGSIEGELTDLVVAVSVDLSPTLVVNVDGVELHVVPCAGLLELGFPGHCFFYLL
jgi:hypothetical protein